MPHILCLCQRGNVRSATAAVILRDFFGVNDVIATGVETTTPETMQVFVDWANHVLVCGDESLMDGVKPFHRHYFYHPAAGEIEDNRAKFIHINIGADIWMKPMHPDLVAKLVPLLDDALKLPHAGYYSDPQTYIQANAAAQAR